MKLNHCNGNNMDWTYNFLAEKSLWLLPLILLSLQFFLKLLICEKPSGPTLWESLKQSPIDIGFLSISFIAASIIIEPDLSKMIIFVMYIIFFIILITFWKLSPSNYLKNDLIIASILTMTNFLISLGLLIFGINMIRV